MSEYVYLADYDGEFSVMTRGEYEATGAEAVYGIAHAAEVAFNLDGWRGHYLAADFIIEAAGLLSEMRWERAFTFGDLIRIMQAVECAYTYHQHQGLHSGVEACNPLCAACEFIHEDADSIESYLTDSGCVVEWNDGVYVYTTPIPTDDDGNPLAWPGLFGSWVDAWNGIYATYADLMRDLADWTADVNDRVLAYGEGAITQDEADARRKV